MAAFAYQYALASLWIDWGAVPAVLVGEGVGEFVAGVIGGVFSLADGVKMVMMRAQLLATDPAWASAANMFGNAHHDDRWESGLHSSKSASNHRADRSCAASRRRWTATAAARHGRACCDR